MCPFSTYRMSTISHQPQWHHTELQLCRWYVPIGTRLRSMHQTVRKHLSGRIPAGAWLYIWYQLNGRSVIVNRNYSEFKQYNIVCLSHSHSFSFSSRSSSSCGFMIFFAHLYVIQKTSLYTGFVSVEDLLRHCSVDAAMSSSVNTIEEKNF